MEREVQDYYEDLIEMFATKGWKIFVEQHENELDRLESTAAAECENNDQWQTRRGEIKKCITVVNYEHLIRSNFQNVVENEQMEERERAH